MYQLRFLHLEHIRICQTLEMDIDILADTKKRGLATKRAHCVYSEAPAHQDHRSPQVPHLGTGEF